MLFTARSAIALLITASAVSARVDGKKRQAEAELELEPRAAPATAAASADELDKRSLLGDVACGVFGGTSCANSVNTQTDVNNCGKTGNVCPTSYANGAGSVTCVSGACTSSCKTGFGFVAGTGCVDTVSNSANCGSIGNACSYANGQAACVASKCTLTSCNSGYQSNGLTGTSLACTAIKTSTVNTQTDVNNCGTAGNVCKGITGALTYQCVSGSCQAATCSSAYTLSSGSCTKIDTTSDTNNCGTVGNKCTTSYANGVGSQCVAGACSPTSCNSGYAFNGAACQTVSSDASNCGSIGNKCAVTGASTNVCSNGVCQASACTSAYTLSNGACTKIDTTSDSNNCGSIGNTCNIAGASAQTCTNSKCVASSCSSGYTLSSSGSCTKINTSSDANNCGSVGNVCALDGANTQVCSAGTCVAVTCKSGYTYWFGKCYSFTDDEDNCGSVGNSCSSLTGSTAATCVSGTCKATSCSSGYTLASGKCTAINTSSDLNNCGSVGNVCAVANAATQMCSSGVCKATTCNTGYGYSNGACVNTQSDTNNCGSPGNVCALSGAATQSCVSGKCAAVTCSSGYVLSSSGTCTKVNTSTDVKNCGSIGNVCAVDGASDNVCTNGVCKAAACNTGYTYSSAGTCTKIDTSSDVNNCGSTGNKCAVTGALTQACVSGTCKATTCTSAYTLSNGACSKIDTTSDTNNCGSVGNVCKVTGASAQSCVSGSCQATACSTGYSLSSGKCSAINTLTDANNCGAVGNVCDLDGAMTQVCNFGTCAATWCDSGYILWFGKCYSYDNDVNNCGSYGNVCPAKGGTAQCIKGTCSMKSCNAGYTLKNGLCYGANGSQAARAKRSKITKPAALCPGSETACPIAGSASFLVSQASGFAAFKAGDAHATGGYECLDTQYALESCGGCASMGEGVNCLEISNSSGVGCSAGVCQVFSCESGYKPNLDATGCVKVPSSHRGRRAASRRAHLTGHSHDM